MKILRIIDIIAVILFFVIEHVSAYSTNSTTIFRSFGKDVVTLGESINVTVNFTNTESNSLRGFYYVEQIPQGLVVNPVSVKIDGNAIPNYIFESGSVGEVYAEDITYINSRGGEK